LSTLLAVWKLTPARAATSLTDTYRRRATSPASRPALFRANVRPRYPRDFLQTM
jgi:hypothetical protein